jgi:MFS transporter, DHA1 family, inner membrane transport protein
VPPLIYLFTLTNLVLGTGAFVLGGILVPIAGSLDVSVAAAGQAMTAYALTSAFLAPLLLVSTGRWPRKRAILLTLVLFTAGSALCAVASSFGALLAGRVLMGVGSAFSALASGVVVAIAAPAIRGRALSISFLGISLSYAIGLPLGTWLGFTYDWRVPLWLVTGACAAVAVAVTVLLPARIEAAGASFHGLREAASKPAVLRVWLRTLLYFVAIFSVFAYVGPVLQALNPVTPGQLSALLVSFGLSGVAGTLTGGWAADRFGPIRTLRVQLSVLTAMMLLVPLTQGSILLCALVFVVWGVAGFGMMAPQQLVLASTAPQQAPLLLSLNGSMLYVGTALGAALSGAVSGAIGFARLAWVGVPFALVALGTLWLDSPRRPAQAAA